MPQLGVNANLDIYNQYNINQAGAAEPGVQGVQLHTTFFLLPLMKNIHFPKNLMNITSLHKHILEASAAPVKYIEL